MSFPATSTSAAFATVLARLTPHFLASANDDPSLARDTAAGLLGSYRAETEEELYLAAEIVSFSFQALEALSEAATPGLSLNQKLRLRGSAVSLSREAHKAHRRLDQRQRARLVASRNAATPSCRPDAPQDTAEHTTSTAGTTPDPAPPAGEPMPANAKPGLAKGYASHTQATSQQQQRNTALRSTENLRHNKAEQEAWEAALASNGATQAGRVGSVVQAAPGVG
jgi:hypothetical protein